MTDVVLLVETIIGRGRTAHIFAPAGGDRVYKLFLRRDIGRSHERMRAVCAAECEAYQILADTPSLVNHAPRFYGRVIVGAVRDGAGRDHSDQYLLDACYSMERLQEDPIGVFAVPGQYRASVEVLMRRFEGCGIKYVVDAEVVGWRSPPLTRLLDFAVYDARAAISD